MMLCVARLYYNDRPGPGWEALRFGGNTPAVTLQMNLKVEDLRCERNDRVLFSGVSFELNPGQVVQVDGPNGSGKTTLLRTVCGLLSPDDGEVLWCDHPISSNRLEYLSEIAFVGHKHGIKDELTVTETLGFDRMLAGRCSTVSDQQALHKLGIGECGTQLCRHLSAGQRQRVALARLLVSVARFWILDEPLTALDRTAQTVIRDLLAEHLDGGGMALVTSHQRLELGEPARTVRLNNG